MNVSQYTEVRPSPRYLVFWNSPPKKSHTRYDISQERSITKGQLSITSIRKIKHAVDNLLFISPWQLHHLEDGSRVRFKINFITLTLPASQIHTDKELKSILDDWINLHRKKGLKHYVWKAEKQKNGNLHFHITTNCFIHYSDIRRTWNSCLSRLGYIDTYRKTQLAWHKDGFRYRPDIYRVIKGKKIQWSRNQQFKSWKVGTRENWTNPNTTDVHSVLKIKDLSAYICKYIAKNKGDKVNGRLWGVSRSLMNKAPTITHSDFPICEFLRHPKAIHSDHFAILPLDQIIHPHIEASLDILRHEILKSD